MKTIDTLVDDIYNLFGSGIEFDQEIAKRFGEMMAKTVSERVPAVNGGGTLRMSNLGRPCERKLWYEVNHSEKREPLPASTRFKFLYGDILEELVLYLAAEAGHNVEGMQDEVEINGVKGHRDAVIDGMLVDVKSASSYSFKKFSAGLKPEEDSFGYIPQLQQYLFAAQDDPVVTIKDKAAFLVIDKTLGKICLDVHSRDNADYNEIVEHKRNVVNSPTEPKRGYSPVEASYGNQKLDVVCSYCDFKKMCYPQLRTFLYSGGPQFLTTVKKVPNVPEASS